MKTEYLIFIISIPVKYCLSSVMGIALAMQLEELVFVHGLNGSLILGYRFARQGSGEPSSAKD